MNKNKILYIKYFYDCFYALQNVRSSFFLYVRLALLFNLFIVSVPYIFAFQINDIYISARGNNQFEAKIRAQKQGAIRAFLLYANKLGITSDDMADMLNLSIDHAIDQVIYKNEKANDFSYSAMANYSLNRSVATNILYDFASLQNRNKFYECMVLPIMKVGRTYHAWDDSIKWIKSWEKSQDILEENKILLFKSNDSFKQNIDLQNVNNLTYKNFEDIHSELPIKKFYIVIAEFYTNLDSGESYLQVEYRNMAPDKVSSLVKKYKLPSNAQLNLTLEYIIDQFTKEFGSKKEESPKNSFETIIENEKNRILQGKLQSLTVNIEVFDVSQWNRISAKLDKVIEIERVIIKNQVGQNYILEFKYNVSLERLTQALLKVGLSYNFVNNKYHLIELNDGI